MTGFSILVDAAVLALLSSSPGSLWNSEAPTTDAGVLPRIRKGVLPLFNVTFMWHVCLRLCADF